MFVFELVSEGGESSPTRVDLPECRLGAQLYSTCRDSTAGHSRNVRGELHPMMQELRFSVGGRF